MYQSPGHGGFEPPRSQLPTTRHVTAQEWRLFGYFFSTNHGARRFCPHIFNIRVIKSVNKHL
jgi:hypothetical protein